MYVYIYIHTYAFFLYSEIYIKPLCSIYIIHLISINMYKRSSKSKLQKRTYNLLEDYKKHELILI